MGNKGEMMAANAWSRNVDNTGWTATVAAAETIVLDDDWGSTVPPPINPAVVDPATFDPANYVIQRRRSGKIMCYMAATNFTN